jgi:hypothetical protein
MNGAAISQAYLMGLHDARALWRQFQTDGIANLETARQALRNEIECLAMGFNGESLDYCKGGRDFWQLRVKLLVAARATQGVAA